VGELLAAEKSGQVTADEWIVLLVHIAFAGNGPTTYAIGNSLLALARDPGQFAALHDGRAMAGEVDECLRFDTPTHVVHRFVTADDEMRGRKLRVGDTVAVVVGAANRDPHRFPEPDEFNIAREAGGQLAFGHGIHFCLGAPLARMELAAVLGAVRSRFDALTLAPSGLVRGDTFQLRGPAKLTLFGK
jgi:cytochrome P450